MTTESILQKLDSIMTWINNVNSKSKDIHEFPENDGDTSSSYVAAYNSGNEKVEKVVLNLGNKVDKEEGKGLSSNDFSNEEKEKLEALKILKGYDEEGDRDTGTIKSTIGDFDDSGNGTKIIISDEDESVKLNQETLLINTDKDGLSNAVAASIYQKEDGQGVKSNNEVNTFRDFVKTGSNASSSNYTNQVVRLVDESDNDTPSGGTKVFEVINRKLGAAKLWFQYVFDFKNEIYSGVVDFFTAAVFRAEILGNENVEIKEVARALSPSVKVDNPNAIVYNPQGSHPTLNFIEGDIHGGEAMYLDVDVETDNLGSTLNFNEDLAYLRGGGGSDIPLLKDHLASKGKKLRFIHGEGNVDSDFNGILNCMVDVSEIENASGKVLVPKEWVDLHKVEKSSVVNFTPTVKTFNGTLMQGVSIIDSNYVQTGNIISFNINFDVTGSNTENNVIIEGLPAPLNELNVFFSSLEYGAGSEVFKKCGLYKSANIMEIVAGTSGLSKVTISGTYVKQN